jgi:hypothetical protein
MSRKWYLSIVRLPNIGKTQLMRSKLVSSCRAPHASILISKFRNGIKELSDFVLRNMCNRSTMSWNELSYSTLLKIRATENDMRRAQWLRVAKNACKRNIMIWKEPSDLELPKICATEAQWNETSKWHCCQKYVQPKEKYESMFCKLYFNYFNLAINSIIFNVAEAPKLYGSHAPIIIVKTSDGYACTPDNLRISVGCSRRTPIQLRLTTHTRINKGVTTTLQHLLQNFTSSRTTEDNLGRAPKSGEDNQIMSSPPTWPN